jgi:hypothetical protein
MPAQSTRYWDRNIAAHVGTLNSSRLRTMIIPREHRAWGCWFTRGRQPLNVHKLGFTELGHAVLFGALLCAAFLL